MFEQLHEGVLGDLLGIGDRAAHDRQKADQGAARALVDPGDVRVWVHSHNTQQAIVRFPDFATVAHVSSIAVPSARFERWVANFVTRHGETTYDVRGGALTGTAADGSDFAARLPFAQSYDGLPDAADFAAAVTAPQTWGILLVRKGGFAVARMAGEKFVESKVGQRHVQGRTKAGGQSQQRFARRRDNQARQAYEAAADHAARILDGLGRAGSLVVTGGDHAAVAEVLADSRLRGLTVVEPWLAVPDPRRAVLVAAAGEAQCVRIDVENRVTNP